jgi:predicted house-cleaning NTP pyrophosphatase (Maf/HAM1 superfamily)
MRGFILSPFPTMCQRVFKKASLRRTMSYGWPLRRLRGSPKDFLGGGSSVQTPSSLIEGRILGKPGNAEEAEKMLSLLSGRDHWVLTGYAIVRRRESARFNRVVETRVKVKDLSQEEIDWYLRTGEPFGKAGAYAIQGAGSFMIEEIHGSYTNVVGLPVCQVLESLRRLGAIDLR